jgi:alpha-L-fucosidase
MGAWLRQYGESVYGTRGGPYRPGDWGVSTHKDNGIYLHILKWPGESLNLPPLQQKVVGSRLLGGGRVAFEQSDHGLTIAVPADDWQPIDTIVKLEVDKG